MATASAPDRDGRTTWAFQMPPSDRKASGPGRRPWPLGAKTSAPSALGRGAAGVQQPGGEPGQVGQEEQGRQGEAPAPLTRRGSSARGDRRHDPGRRAQAADEEEHRQPGREHAGPAPRGSRQDHPGKRSVAHQDRPVADGQPLHHEGVPHHDRHRDQTCHDARADQGGCTGPGCHQGQQQHQLLQEHATEDLVEDGDHGVGGDGPRERSAEAERVRSEAQVRHPHHVVAQDVAGAECAAEQQHREHAWPRRSATARRACASSPHRPVLPRWRHLRVCRMSTRARDRSRRRRRDRRAGSAACWPGSGQIAVAMMLMNVATYGFTMAAARIIGPVPYGAYFALMNLVMIVSVVTLGLQATAARRISADPAHVGQIEREILRVSLRASLLLGGVLLLGAPLVNHAARPRQSAHGRCSLAVAAVPHDHDGRPDGHPAGRAAVARARRSCTSSPASRGSSSASH